MFQKLKVFFTSARFVIPALILLPIVFFIIVSVSGPHTLADKNGQAFKNAIYALPNDTKQVDLRDLTPFDWDYMYSFYPYMSVEEIENIIGFKSNEIRMVESENIQQMLFVKDNKVVCSIFGSLNKLNFYFNLGEFEDRQIKISKTDDAVFDVETRNGIKYFSIAEE